MGEGGQGAIILQLSADGKVTNALPQTKAEEETLLFELPSVEDFSIRLEKTDGSFSKDYPTVEHFKKETGFPTGAYKLTALYGDPREMRFGIPAFYGSTDLVVLEGQTTAATVTATVAHALISIDYTDEFKNYLHDYSAEVHSDGYGYLAITEDAEGVACVVPGNVKIAVEFTNPQNQTVKLQPAEFEALAGHHYHIVMNVNGGEVGDAQLQITFDNSLTREEVLIDLTEELFTSPAPTVKAVGFDNNADLEFLSGEAPEGQLRFNVISHGGLKEVNLSLNGTDASGKSFVPAFGNELNLVNAPANAQNQLAQLGIDCKGLFNNPDKMAIVDFSSLPGKMAPGSYEISLSAKDSYSRVSDPVTFRFTAVAPTLEATGLTAIAGLNEGTVSVSYNGSHPDTDITFKAQNKMGVWVDAKVLGIIESAKTRALPVNNYVFTIQLPDTEHSPMNVKVYLYGEEKQTVTLDIEQPQYSLSADGFAGKVLVKVSASDEQLPLITANLNFFEEGVKIADDRIRRNVEDGFITISGFNPSESDANLNSYTLYSSFGSKVDSNSKSVGFTTEVASNLPNADFQSFSETINIPQINAGAPYEYSVWVFKGHYQNRSSIVINTPDEWDNVNSITCNYDGSSEKNTWYVVPSTLQTKAGEVVIRTVGYNPNGPALQEDVASTWGYYSKNHPTYDQLIARAGELSYGTESSKGKAFSSRPASMTFNYAYESRNGESARARVVVYSNGNVIGTGTADVNSASGQSTVSIKYVDDRNLFNKKATSIAVVFTSSTVATPYIYIPEGDELNDNPNPVPNAGSWGASISANSYKSYASGSQLTISNVNLNY